MSPFRFFRMLLLRWHRRVGVVLLVFIVMLVVTGIAINHSTGWGFDKTYVQQNWLLNYYGIAAPELRSYRDHDNWLTQSDVKLYLNKTDIGRCDGKLLGAVKHNNLWFVLCEGRLQLLNHYGARLDDVSETLGLPKGATAIGATSDAVYVRAKTAIIQFDPDLLSFTEIDGDSSGIHWATLADAPDALRQYWHSAHRGKGVSWERVLLDLHSGRLFGPFGVIVTDIAAVFLLLLALSGVWVWITKPGRWRS